MSYFENGLSLVLQIFWKGLIKVSPNPLSDIKILKTELSNNFGFHDIDCQGSTRPSICDNPDCVVSVKILESLGKFKNLNLSHYSDEL